MAQLGVRIQLLTGACDTDVKTTMNNTNVKTTLIHTHVKTTRLNHETVALSLTPACLHAVKGSVAMSLQMYANNMRDTLS